MKNKLLLLVLFFAISCSQQITKEIQVQKTENSKKVTSSIKIDEKTISQLKTTWQSEYIIADGVAPIIKKYSEENRNLMLAKRAAIIDAQRNLAEKINEVRINATTTMSDFQTIDFVQSKISARLKGTEIINDFYNKEKNLYEIRIQMPKWEIAGIIEEYSTNK